LKPFAALRLLPVLALLHHHFHGSPIDYSALGVAAAASFFGLPGPGEPLLVAAGILAAKHKLDIGEVVLVAFGGATVGGVAGWILGLAAGRTVLTTRGPLHAARTRALRRGDEIFRRHPVIGVLVAPSWIAGIHRVTPRLFLGINALSALVWAAGIGIGAYYAGPAVIEWVDDLGWVTGAGLVLILLAVVAAALRKRRRRPSQEAG
jgi:membrane protein DedA with SNARE-associated domain